MIYNDNYNGYVTDYCAQNSIDVLGGPMNSYLVEGDKIVAEFRNHENIITFFHDNNNKLTVMKKSDLLLFLLENTTVQES